MVLKVCDIGNVTKGRDVTIKWTERVVAEFFAQGDLEAEMKLPVTPFMDRRTACVPKQQVGFYNFVAKPMFEAMDQLVSMEQPLKNLEIMVRPPSLPPSPPPSLPPSLSPSSPSHPTSRSRSARRLLALWGPGL